MAKGVQKNEQKHAHQKGQAGQRACQVSGCKNEYRAKGYCARHYRMWRRGAFGHSRYRSCSKSEPKKCTRPAKAMGLCEEHLAEVVKTRAPKNEGGGEEAAAAPAE